MKFIRFRSSAKFHFAKNKLFRTHSIQTCILMGTGDAIAQTVVEKTDYNQFDFRRTLKFAFVGLIFVVSTHQFSKNVPYPQLLFLINIY